MRGAGEVAHLASAAVDVPAAFALERLADAAAVGRWALGCMDLEPSGEANVYRGTSLFDGASTYVEIRPHPSLGLIDYWVGSAAARRPRISIRVVAADLAAGGPAHTCLVGLIAWRPADASPERWARTCASHETEILLIKAQLETAHAREHGA